MLMTEIYPYLEDADVLFVKRSTLSPQWSILILFREEHVDNMRTN